ncbi:hypothetical protein C2S51_002756 [Perilla frutescens var. frutescens]|nr:hypothetical protein C2S51_002756 [Perilla frutescens var. frutescens]
MDHQVLPAAKRGKRKSGADSLKVVYISSPMKVRTSATRFRSLVQQLTGKNSDIARYMDADGGAADFRDQDGMLLRNDDGGGGLSSVSSDDTTTTNTTTTTAATTSDSFLDNNYAAASRMEDQFAGFFSPESFCDVLGSYHGLLM